VQSYYSINDNKTYTILFGLQRILPVNYKSEIFFTYIKKAYDEKS